MLTHLPNLPHALAIFIGVAVLLFLAVAVAPAMASSEAVRDAALKFTRALPASTAAVTSAAGQIFDTGVSSKLDTQNNGIELLITVPAVTTAQLPDTKTFTYKLIMSANADLSSSSDVYGSFTALLQTGAGGAGAVGATKRVRLPSDCLRYVGLVITPSGSGTGDASGVNATLEVLF